MDVKVGDKVLIRSRWKKSIGVVKTVTPKGFIRLENGGYYDIDGREKTSDVWDSSTIVPLTEELEYQLKEEKFVSNTLKLMNEARNITYEQAVKIKEILDRT